MVFEKLPVFGEKISAHVSCANKNENVLRRVQQLTGNATDIERAIKILERQGNYMLVLLEAFIEASHTYKNILAQTVPVVEIVSNGYANMEERQNTVQRYLDMLNAYRAKKAIPEFHEVLSDKQRDQIAIALREESYLDGGSHDIKNKTIIDAQDMNVNIKKKTGAASFLNDETKNLLRKEQNDLQSYNSSIKDVISTLRRTWSQMAKFR